MHACFSKSSFESESPRLPKNPSVVMSDDDQAVAVNVSGECLIRGLLAGVAEPVGAWRFFQLSSAGSQFD